MKITIDTKEDSHEEIRKIIRMLSSLVGEKSFSNQPNIFEDDNEPTEEATEEPTKTQPTNAFANMFGPDPITPSEETEESTENEEIKVEEEEDLPDVIEYH